MGPRQTIAHYRFTTKLGEGGMGEVWRAIDTKLNRDVAIKILPDAFAHDADRMARFTREAQLLASLNHPNIAAIYGVEERALVMELVDGQTLPAGLPLDEALNYGRQIAEALEYAHERGVIHRDLKPANIKVTSEGAVKVLDFGLAKAIEDHAPSAGDSANSPTLTLGATRIGVLLGTAAYMSPEQAAGKQADRRADIWSFGAVLYEILSGKQAFAGESVSETLACVLKLDPDWSALPASTPPAIRKLVHRCLTRDRRQRLQAIGEARIAIEEVLSGAPPPEAAEPIPAKRALVGWIVAALLAVALAVTGWSLWRTTRPVDRPLVRLTVDLGPGVSLYGLRSLSGRRVIISPDGSRLVYLANGAGGQRKLFLRRLDQPNTTELAGTEGAGSPFFSPDGRWIGFLAGDKMNKISAEGGAVVPLATETRTAGGANGTWGSGEIFFSRPFLGIVGIPASGGAPKPVAELEHEFGQLVPEALPGGKAVLFAAYPAASVSGSSIEAISLDTHRRKKILTNAASPRYAPTGHLLYMSNGVLFAVAFDPDRLETRGEPVPMLDDVSTSGGLGECGQFDFSRTGTLVYLRGYARTRPKSVIHWLDTTGKTRPMIQKPDDYRTPSFSPDGRKLAVGVGATEPNGNVDIQVYDLQRETWTRLTFGDGAYYSPIWSPDGKYVIFGSAGKGIFWSRADGGQPQPLTAKAAVQFPTSFSPAGHLLAFSQIGDTPGQVWIMPLEEQSGGLKAGKPEQIINSSFSDVAAVFSPDGRWLAYQSSRSGKNEVYVQGPGGTETVSTDRGEHPVWSPNRHKLFYQSGDQLLAVSYQVNGDRLVLDKPRVWAAKLGGPQWDLAPDGQSVAVVSPIEPVETAAADHEVVFLENFFDELKRRVPIR